MHELLFSLFELIAMPVVLVILIGKLRTSERARRATRLEPFVKALEGGTYADGPGGPTVEGRLRGRRVRLVLRGAMSYQLEAPGCASFVVGAGEAKRLATTGAHATEAVQAMQHLFLVSDRLEAADGWLTVRRPMSDYAMSLPSIMAVLDALERVAPLFARKRVDVRIAGVAREVHAWSAGEQVLCPFCRDALAGAESLELAACERCGTAQHAECMTENGGCSVFGCLERPGPERVPAR